MGKNRVGLLGRWFGREEVPPPAGSTAADPALTPGTPAASRRSTPREAAGRVETLRWIVAGNEQTDTVEVEDDSDFGVRVNTPAELAVGETVWLTFSGDVEKCVVRHCRPAESGYVVGLYRVRNERRRENREVVEGKADLFYGGLGADVSHVEVDVRDISPGGMQVLTSRPIPPQTAVRVSGQDFACLGVTCYCRPDGERYAVGIQFTQDPYYKESAEYDG